MNGWVSLHRKVFENPIIKPKKPYSKFEAWCWLIIRANHSDNKFVLGNEIIKAKAGEVITSQKKLAAQFGWGNTKVRNFLKLLESDSMIVIKTTSKTTCLTICNYLTYQESQTKNKLKTNRKQTANKSQTNIINNNNNSNNVNKIKRTTDLKNEVYSEKNIYKYGKEMLDEFYLFYSEPTQDGKKMKFQTFNTWSTAGRLSTWSKKDYNGYFKAHKDELFRKNENKPVEVDESELDPKGLKEFMGELSKQIGRS
mgnify:CR=1 FL=1|tara:strand:+ start:2376 stop:3137 length:762 start_codon:yes stop_codon:yes gene_type:complete